MSVQEIARKPDESVFVLQLTKATVALKQLYILRSRNVPAVLTIIMILHYMFNDS